MAERLKKPAHSATAISNSMELYIPLDGLVNLDKEKEEWKKIMVKVVIQHRRKTLQ